MNQEYSFAVLGTKHLPKAEEKIEEWARLTKGGISIGDDSWDYRVILGHSPVPRLTTDILNSDEEIVFPKGTLVKDIAINPETNYYWEGNLVSPAILENKLDSFRNAISIILHINGERHHVGWVPASLANKMIHHLAGLYISSATYEKGRLVVTTRFKKDYNANHR